MFHFFVCDDEKEQCDAIEKMILDNMKEYRQSCKIMKFYEAAHVMESIENNKIHAAFLDIDMAGTSGIELARQITEADASVYILFVSSHEEMVFEAIHARPLRFIRKSCLAEDMKEAVSALCRELSGSRKIICFASGKNSIDVEMQEIVSIESMAHYLRVILVKTEFKVRGKISDYLSELDENMFVRIQKGIVINMRHIEKMRSGKVLLDRGMEYNISRAWMDDVRKAFMKFMRRGEM